MTARRRILMLHQGAELYGSDLIFAEAVGALRSQFDISVVLDSKGPLRDRLEMLVEDVRVAPLGVLRGSSTSPAQLPRTARAVAEAVARVRDLVRDTGAAAVYSNTAGVISGALAARSLRRAHIWHLHEILRRGTAASVLARTGWACSTRVLCVSRATRSAILASTAARDGTRAVVCHNGIADVAGGVPASQVWRSGRPFRVALVGRVSAWKGQDVLLRALLLMDPQTREAADVVIVGDVFSGNERVLHSLEDFARDHALGDCVRFLGFRADTDRIMSEASVVVVPSTQPDPFPTVVLEAMRARTPVIGSALGGIPEMITNGATGLLVRGGDAAALAGGLQRLHARPDLARRLGRAGRARYERDFTLAAFEERLVRAVSSALDVRAGD
jgi:glycosyltransferase involved in cell wall biosynthesis